jgi:hypothetical protein
MGWNSQFIIETCRTRFWGGKWGLRLSDVRGRRGRGGGGSIGAARWVDAFRCEGLQLNTWMLDVQC